MVVSPIIFSMQYYIKSVPRANLDSGEQSYDGEYHLTIRARALE